MKRITLVTGYPRSRTCWLSELLTVHRHSFAFHEASIASGSCLGWRAKLDMRHERNVIDCNASTVAFLGLPEFYEAFPDANYVLIMRDKETCRSSYEDFLGDLMAEHCQASKDAAWIAMEKNYEILMADPNVIKFDYDLLDYEPAVKRLCDHIAPGFPWDAERFDQLTKKKIVQNLDAFVKVPLVD